MQVIGVLLVVLSISFACVGSDENTDEESDKRETAVIPNNMTIPNKVEWTVIPFITGFTIHWHNLDNFSNNISVQLDIHFNNGTDSIQKNITTTDFIDGHYNLTDLTNGTAYRFVNVSLGFAEDMPREVQISWLWESNKQDNNNKGILVGANHDNDGWADSVDEDKDNDNVSDGTDSCRLGEIGWQSNNMTDHDNDGCQDSSEDKDDDNDNKSDIMDDCRLGERGWRRNITTDYDDDGCRDSSEDKDDDNDGVPDDHPDSCPRGVKGWKSNVDSDFDGDGCRDRSEDLDDDNDGLTDMADAAAGCQFNPDCDNDSIKDGVDMCVNGDTGWQSSNMTDYDNDGCRDSDEDMDDDNDTKPDDMDNCRLGEIGWQRNNMTDYDDDGCRDDSSEDRDDDNDNKSDTMDNCRLGDLGWQSNSMTDYDDDGCRDDGEDKDDDNDGVDDMDEAAGCRLNTNCDNDSLEDGLDACPTGQRGWMDNGTNDVDRDGCRNDEDIDDDGNSLIEIRTARELDAVRYALNGAGYQSSATAPLNQTGCGGRGNIMVCSGYELVNNISLTDYIANTNSREGWQPIGHDTNTGDCDGEVFTAIFNGNGFVVSGLFINRSQDDCIGLFGQANGTIHHLGVVADRIIGGHYVGGLVGISNGAKILQSYVVSGEVNGYGNNIGGLIGWGNATKLLQSYAVIGSVNGSSNVGGLIGNGTSTEIAQSYAVSSLVNGTSNVGGLVGFGISTEIIHSYALSGLINGNSNIGGLVGSGGTAMASYWDNQASGKADDNATGSSGRNSTALRSPTDYTDIYDTWDDGLMIDGIDDDTTMWCDEDLSGSIESGEMMGDNRIWDFGTTTDYPAIRCTPGSLIDQRVWWHLNSTTNKPQLDRAHLSTWLVGSPP